MRIAVTLIEGASNAIKRMLFNNSKLYNRRKRIVPNCKFIESARYIEFIFVSTNHKCAPRTTYVVNALNTQ